MGDIKAKVGKEQGSKTVGKYGIGTSKENGTIIAQRTMYNNWFSQQLMYFYTWKTHEIGSKSKVRL